MHSTTKRHWTHVLLWLGWVLVLLALALSSAAPLARLCPGSGLTWTLNPMARATQPPVLALVVSAEPCFPWHPRGRWRKWALARYRAARRAYQRAVWAARLARLGLTGALRFATLVDWLTRTQLRRQLGALPVLYALLEILQVRVIINRYCPSAAEVAPGTVAVVLVLNRLMAPRPLYKVADWLAQTILIAALGIPAAKFNDDRLARTLDLISAHTREIWLDIVHQALLRFDIDLHFLFYDLTAFVMQGEFAQSELADYGFAHNTPSNKQKVKLGVNVAGDGFIPTAYEPCSGRTADLATVQQNMERLCRLLARRGWPIQDVLIIGDRANLNDELAVTYDTKGLKYLAGLKAQKKHHAELLRALPERQFVHYPLGTAGYWGWPCQVTFTHHGLTVTHRGLVVLSGPMRHAVRQDRAEKLRALHAELKVIQDKIGHKRYRSLKEVQARANTCLRRSAVGKLMRAEASQTSDGQVQLRWWVDHQALWQVMQADGRYLLVSNDWTLSLSRMLELYRAKDGIEKRFEVAKQALKVSPLYVHSDERIQALLLINMLALLAYSLLERQVQSQGLRLTPRRIIEQLSSLSLIETHCWDGSVLYRLTPIDEEQAQLLLALHQVIVALVMPSSWPVLMAGVESFALPPPLRQGGVEC